MSISTEEKDRYLRETAIVLAREGFQTGKTDTGKLRVLLDGAPLCEVTENGGITYRNEDINLIKFPQRGVCLYKCGNERYLLEVHAPSYKEKLFGTAGGR